MNTIVHALLCLLLVAAPADDPSKVEARSSTTAVIEPSEAEAEPSEAEPPAAAEPSGAEPRAEGEPREPEPRAEAEPREPEPPAPVDPAPVLMPVAAPPSPPEPRRTWMVGAFVDAGYAFASNRPDNHVNRGLATAPRIGEFTVPMAAGQVRHDASEQEPWQLELALQFGPAATALVVADPLPGGDASRFTGIEVWQHVGRANAGGRIPGLGTEISAGVFGTPIGYWSFWPKDNWTYSTPWHLNAVPYGLMGGRVLQPVGERVVLHAWVVNGWQSYADVNRVPSYMGGVIGRPIDGLQLGQFVYFGPEDHDPNARAFRVLSDTWAIYDAERWGISAVFDVTRERLTLQPGEPVALYVTGAVTPRVRLWRSARERVKWWLAARGEAFWDRDGRMFGVDQLLGSVAVDTDVDIFGHLLLRLEYRYDRSTNPAGFFYRGNAIRDTDPGLGRDQHTIFLMATGRFEHWFGVRDRS
jgi:Putative beta-barrel porin-2, OmpL-like. bbp2